MKNGYYLSTYLHISPIAYLYHISLRHDQTVALWNVQDDNITLVRYWELERKTGIKKHDLSFFSTEQCKRVIELLLEEVELSLNDINEIWGTPGLSINGNLVSSYNEGNPCPYHSLCHLFSGLMIDTDTALNGKILAFALDGGPDNVVDKNARNKQFYWGAYCNHGKLTYFPVPSPGAFWSMMKLRFGIEEGTLMALGSASTAEFPESEALLEDVPFVYDGDGFDEAYKWIERLDLAASQLDKTNLLHYDERFSDVENRISAVVKLVQTASERILHQVVANAIKTFNIEPAEVHLTMTGGFALNCPTNSYLMRSFHFQSFDTCPCVSDTGIALGIGLYEFYSRKGRFHFKLENACYGSEELRSPISFLQDDWQNYIKSITEFDPVVFADDLYQSPIVWFDGRAEIGPRALGARSILGNPSDLKTKKILNTVKQRQWWRPVAPIIILEEQEEWFHDSFASPYMLCTSYVKKEKQKALTAALHLDDSARIQSISKFVSSRLKKGILAFQNKTEIPVICNTSLNDKGEPIIDSFEECLNFALRKKIDIVYLNGYRCCLRNHSQYPETSPYPRHRDWFDIDDESRSQACHYYNPSGLSREELDLYLNLPELTNFDITDPVQIHQLQRILKQWKRMNQSVWAAILL